jgi:hypothetical protein
MGQFDLESYVSVNERIKAFWAKYPNGRIVTRLEHIDTENAKARMVIVHAEVYADRDSAFPIATGLSKEREGTTFVNKTSFVENADTSAIGRALATAGFLVEKERPSREEMESVARQEQEHQAILDKIKTIAKTAPTALKGKVKEQWVAAKEDKLVALDLLATVEAEYEEV